MAETLSERAARLMLDGSVWPDGDGTTVRRHPASGLIVFFDPEEDLNDAAELWRRAPEEVIEAVERVYVESYPVDPWELCRALSELFTNSEALTRTVVEEWERFNGQ